MSRNAINVMLSNSTQSVYCITTVTKRSCGTSNIRLFTMFSWLKGEEKPKIDVTEFHQPEFYHGTQGPNFKVLTAESKEDYDARIYQPTKWITSKMEVKDYEEGSSKSFWQLFNYIGGKNETKSKVAMTCPVRSTVEVDEDKVKSARMSFFVDPTKDCPAPAEEGLFFEEEGEKKFYVCNFGGFAKHHLYTEHLKKLKAALDRDGKGYVTDTYYTAGHDPPFRLWGRRNEVYVEAKD